MTLLKQTTMPSSNRKPTECTDADCFKAYNKFVKKNKAAVLDKSECVDGSNKQYRIKYETEEKEKYFRVKTHRMWFYGTSELIKMAEDHDNYTVSHLCHSGTCINPAHLVLESLAVNKSRNACPGDDKCFHKPPCLKPGHQASSLPIAVWDRQLSLMVKK